MAQRKGKGRSTDRKQSEAQKPEPTPDGILVRYEGEQVHVAPVGKIKATELPVLLRQAAKVAEQGLGV